VLPKPYSRIRIISQPHHNRKTSLQAVVRNLKLSSEIQTNDFLLSWQSFSAAQLEISSRKASNEPAKLAERVIAPGEAAEPGVTAKTDLSPRAGDRR
jgi:hypothetical protein